MPHGLAHFSREFLAESDDPSEDTAITTRVSTMEEDDFWMFASLTIGSGGEGSRIHLDFSGGTPEEVDQSLAKAEKLASIIAEFTKALQVEAKKAKKMLPKE